MRVGERAFGTDDAVCDSRLGHEKRARDLVRCEPADQAQRERKLRLGAQHGMARRENQAEKIVADVVVLPVEKRAAADEIDRAMLRCGHEPRAGIRRDALAWPLFERSDERSDERSVREIFGDADVVRDARQTGDQARRLDAPDGVDRGVRVGVRAWLRIC